MIHNRWHGLEKEDQAGGLKLSNFKTYYKATVMKKVWYWHDSKHADQWNRVGCPKSNPCF